jgi:aminoglycoside 3-N-acetyltransferase
MSNVDVEQTCDRIADELAALGLPRGACVLVHSSLSAMGQVPGGPETVISGIQRALGPRGTLLIPALSFKCVNQKNPFFSVTDTPSCVGAIPEYFRTRPGTQRSVHPTHSVCAAGPAAPELLEQHHRDDTPCGMHSPYRALRDRGGVILFLGCGMRPNTSMHAVEELICPPYLFDGHLDVEITQLSGAKVMSRIQLHSFAGFDQRYDRLELLLSKREMRAGKVLAANAQLVDCQSMWEKALTALKRDSHFFVEPLSQSVSVVRR